MPTQHPKKDSAKIAEKIELLAEDPDVARDDAVVRALQRLANDVRRRDQDESPGTAKR